MISKFKLFLALTFFDKLLLIESVLLLVLASLHVSFRPKSATIRRLGLLNSQTKVAKFDNRTEQVVMKVKEFNTLAQEIVPWHTTCLAHSLAAKWVLDHRSIPCTVYIGFRKDSETNKLHGHAWTRCGTRLVAGGDQATNFITSAYYGND